MSKVLPILVIIAIVAFIGIAKPGFSFAGQAPDFSLYDAKGRVVTLSEQRGKVIVLDFWASWCPPCRAAMPAMDRLYNTYKDRGVIVYGININDTADPIQFMYKMGVNYPLLVNGEPAAEIYRVEGIPTLVVIGVDGNILYRDSGWSPQLEDKIATIIEKELNKNNM